MNEWTLADVLHRIEATFDRFVATPSPHVGPAVALWIAHTWVIDRLEITPRLAFVSAEKRSGKSRALEVVQLLVKAPMSALNASVPALFRSIEGNNPPTILLDELDTVFVKGSMEGAEDLRGLLNAGHRRGVYIPRCVGQKHEVKMFPTFAAVAGAGIGDLPDTIMDRSVVVRMRRRKSSELVESFRWGRVEREVAPLRDWLQAWTDTSAPDLLEHAEPLLPLGVTDRAADVWEPLLAVAELAGSLWAERGRAAAAYFVAQDQEENEDSLGSKLLADVREVWSEPDRDRMPTDLLLSRLHSLPETPWGDWWGIKADRGARDLARKLKPYGVKPTTIRIGDNAVRGYRIEDLSDAWDRYLPDSARGGATSATSATSQVRAVADADRFPQHPQRQRPSLLPTCWGGHPANELDDEGLCPSCRAAAWAEEETA